VAMLNEMRLGTLSQQSISKFKALQRVPQFDDNIEPTELFPTRSEVDRANSNRMKDLPGKIHTFYAEEGGTLHPESRTRLLDNCMAPKILELKKDTQVMLIKNTEEQVLVNGSLGKVIGFMSDAHYALCHSEAIDAETAVNLYGQSINDPEALNFVGPEEDFDFAERKTRVVTQMRNLPSVNKKLYPLVQFTTPTGQQIDKLISTETWRWEAPNGDIQAYRTQIPLILAYAISIHKAQGQTLSRVRVDLGRIFEKGQAYVALSRATCREGLQILRFDPSKVMAHPKVAQFYRSLEDVDKTIKRKSDAARGWHTETLENVLAEEEADEDPAYEYQYGNEFWRRR
jgi:ATP-dependent DNA helicase PIF1